MVWLIYDMPGTQTEDTKCMSSEVVKGCFFFFFITPGCDSLAGSLSLMSALTPDTHC